MLLAACYILSAFVTKYNEAGIMANGQQTYVGAIACPRDIELGTPVVIDGTTYICADRTNKKYDGRFDIFSTSSTHDLLEWGKQRKDIVIE